MLVSASQARSQRPTITFQIFCQYPRFGRTRYTGSFPYLFSKPDLSATGIPEAFGQSPGRAPKQRGDVDGLGTDCRSEQGIGRADDKKPSVTPQISEARHEGQEPSC